MTNPYQSGPDQPANTFGPPLAVADQDPAGRPVPGDLPRRDLRVAAVLAALLAVFGIPLGLLWGIWSPPGPEARILRPGVFIPGETEAFVAADGRYLVITAAVGLVAGLVAWRLTTHRGPLVLLGLVVGGLVGSLLMELFGHLIGGGSFTGKTFHYEDGTSRVYTAQLPVSLHVHGLLFAQSTVAVLVYGLFVAFAVRDDLGRPDPVRDMLTRDDAESVDAGDEAQHGGRYGDAPGPLQQRDLPPQQPPQAY